MDASLSEVWEPEHFLFILCLLESASVILRCDMFLLCFKVLELVLENFVYPWYRFVTVYYPQVFRVALNTSSGMVYVDI